MIITPYIKKRLNTGGSYEKNEYDYIRSVLDFRNKFDIKTEILPILYSPTNFFNWINF